MAITIKHGRLLARSACLIVIALDGTGVAWAQLPYTPLTTPLQGGSASQPPSVGGGGQGGGGGTSSASNGSSAPGGGNGPATVAPGASAAFTPAGAPTGGGPAQRGVEFTPRVLVRESFSDNINLAPSNQAKADFITEIVPGFDLRANGKRVQASLDYSLQGVLYGIHGGSDHVNNQVSGHALGTILPQHLFLSADTSYTQAIINPAAPSSASGALATGNTTNAWVAELNPYWLQGLGPFGNAKIGYIFNNIQYSGGGLGSKRSNTYQASLTSPSGPSRWSWSGNYRHYKSQQGDGRQTTQQNASAELGYQVLDHITLLADGGWEQNRQKQQYSSNFQGSYWAAGFRWQTPFNSLTFKYGHRFFGPTYDASWTHRAARLTTTLAYKETVTQVSQDLASQAIQSAQSPSGQTLPNVPLGTLSSSGLYVSRRFSGSVRYAFSRTTLGVTGYDERRHYLGGLGRSDEHVSGATLDGSWKAGPRTSVRPSVTWQHNQPSGGAPYTLISPQIAVNYQISRSAHGEAGYRYEDRQSNTASERYQMNMVYLQVSVSF